jgi:hypothetical protein
MEVFEPPGASIAADAAPLLNPQIPNAKALPITAALMLPMECIESPPLLNFKFQLSPLLK